MKYRLEKYIILECLKFTFRHYYSSSRHTFQQKKIIQQITDTIQNLIKLEAELQVLVQITDVQMMVEKIIGVIIDSKIPDSEKVKIAEEIKKITQ